MAVVTLGIERAVNQTLAMCVGRFHVCDAAERGNQRQFPTAYARRGKARVREGVR
jgi:hypothetical protein